LDPGVPQTLQRTHSVNHTRGAGDCHDETGRARLGILA
ncbi:MAG: hypothetical protein QOG17_333, partial [Gammaproteobacteria bacterium]|nr:hypothetical protein [Gammaproteobacteria bacterium]